MITCRPELLQHPNIPKAMHGLNPRTLLGKAWWDETRFTVQKDQDYCCAACGVHKSEAWPNRWLECHEDYTIDYAKGIIEIKEFVCLCPACHKFIHSGRLSVTDEQTWAEKLRIVQHGWDVLSNAKMYHSMATWYLIDQNHLPRPENWIGLDNANSLLSWQMPPDFNVTGKTAEWSDWRMHLNGEIYEPIHKSMAAWTAFYS